MTTIQQLRPPLEARARLGAKIAGGVSFPLFGIGYLLFVAPMVIAIFGGLILIFLSNTDRSSPFYFMDGAVVNFHAQNWILPLVGVTILGMLLWVGALFFSLGVLRSHGVARRNAVTWSAFGISIVASTMIGWVVSALSRGIIAAAAFLTGPSGGFAWLLPVIISAVIGVALNVVIGLFAWRWMASVFRPRVAAAAPHA